MSETNLTPQLPAIARDDEIACLESDSGQEISGFDAELIPASHKKLFASLVSGKGNQVMVLPEDIRIIPGFNPRLDTEAYRAHVQNVAESILSEGYYMDKPLAGYAGMDGRRPVVYLTEGQTRYRASLIAIERGAPPRIPAACSQTRGHVAGRPDRGPGSQQPGQGVHSPRARDHLRAPQEVQLG